MELSELESKEVECFKDQLQKVIKPYQQEQNRRQKKSDFLENASDALKKMTFFN